MLLTIYDTEGGVVRQLDLGHRGAGYYTDRGKAVYWDGRNQLGESVASAGYFYHWDIQRTTTRGYQSRQLRQFM